MHQDPFQEYLKQKEPDKQQKRYAWRTAIGLQAVDQLEPSEYLVKTALQNIEGKITLQEARELLDRYYEETPATDENDRTEEADKVSVRIAEILAENAFSFTPNQYLSIHKKLFHGIYDHAGKMRTYNITKKEWVLDGATVTYGSVFELRAALEYDFSLEQAFCYKGLSMNEMIRHLAFFIARLWQIHIFSEGNTRTTAVFFIKYLKTLGFDAANDIFAENAWYFRNALVRANYNDLKNNVHETTEYLEYFLKNLLLNKKNELRNRELHISGLFTNSPKQDIDLVKQDISYEKQDIDLKTIFKKELFDFPLSIRSLRNAQILYSKFQNTTVFGRSNVMETLHITASPASELIKKLLKAHMILSVKGHGKGKYLFSR